MRLGDIIQDNNGSIRLIVQDNTGSVRHRMVYLHYKTAHDNLNGTISGGIEKHTEAVYAESTVIGNILDIIARCKDV